MKVEAQDIIYHKNLGNLWFDTLPREGEIVRLKDEKGFTTTYKVHSIVHEQSRALGQLKAEFNITLNLEPK